MSSRALGGLAAAAGLVSVLGVDLAMAGRLGPGVQGAVVVGLLPVVGAEVLGVLMASLLARVARREEHQSACLDGGLVLAAALFLPMGALLARWGPHRLSSLALDPSLQELAPPVLGLAAYATGVAAAGSVLTAMDLRLGRRGVAFAGLLFHVVAELCFTWMFGWGGGGQVPQGASGIAQAHVLAASTALVLRLGLLAADRQLVGSRGLLRFRNLRLVPWGAIAGEARRLLPLLLLSALGLVLVGSGLSGGARGASTSGLLAWLAGVAALVGAAVPLARIGYTVLGTASAVALVTILGPRALLLLATDGIVREHCIRPLPWVVALGLALGAGWAWWTARNEPGSARTLAEVPRMGSE